MCMSESLTIWARKGPLLPPDMHFQPFSWPKKVEINWPNPKKESSVLTDLYSFMFEMASLKKEYFALTVCKLSRFEKVRLN